MLINAVPPHRVISPQRAARELVRDVLPVVIATRLFFVLMTYIMTLPFWQLFPRLKPYLNLQQPTHTPFDFWNRWDAIWYGNLAQLGYNVRGPNHQYNLVFFPLYPLLTRTLHDALSLVMSNPAYLVCGMIISNVCTAAALIFFYLLVRLDFSRATAQRAVTLLALFPMSFYTFAAYSEGPFLLCAMACLYTLRLRRWWQAGLWGLLASIARPPGMVLLIPFMMAWVDAHPVVAGSLAVQPRLLGAKMRLLGRVSIARVRLAVERRVSHQRQYVTTAPDAPDLAAPIDIDERRTRRRSSHARNIQSGRTHTRTMGRFNLVRPATWPGATTWRNLSPDLRGALLNVVPAIAIPLGLVSFMVFLYIAFQDPLSFSSAQQAWWRTFAPPWETLWVSVAFPLGDLVRGTFFTVADRYGTQDFLYTAAGLILTVKAWRRLPRIQSVYLWLLWLVLLTSPAMLTDGRTHQPHHDVLMSMPRMMLMLFPLATYLAQSRRLYSWLAAAFLIGLAIYTGIFLSGGWVA